MARPVGMETRHFGKTWRWVDEMFETSPEGCWIWPFGKDGRGYPVIWDRTLGRARKASHYVLEKAGRPRPPGALALHSCDEPRCLNPGHLRWGTDRENAEDRTIRGRWRVDHPGRHSYKELE